MRLLALATLLAVAALAESMVSGRVVDSQGKAVAGAVIRFVRADGATVAEIRSDSAGQFAFAAVPAGAAAVLASAPGFAPVKGTLSPSGGQNLELRFEKLEAQLQSVVISAHVVEPRVDLRNAEVFNRTLFTRDDQVFQQLNAGHRRRAARGRRQIARDPPVRLQSRSWRREWRPQGAGGRYAAEPGIPGAWTGIPGRAEGAQPGADPGSRRSSTGRSAPSMAISAGWAWCTSASGSRCRTSSRRGWAAATSTRAAGFWHSVQTFRRPMRTLAYEGSYTDGPFLNAGAVSARQRECELHPVSG